MKEAKILQPVGVAYPIEKSSTQQASTAFEDKSGPFRKYFDIPDNYFRGMHIPNENKRRPS